MRKNDKSGNKQPKDSEGNPWFSYEHIDVNQLLGYVIGYKGFDEPDERMKSRLRLFERATSKRQMYGWDTPYYKNARIQKQLGFFVYGIDVTTPLEESIVEHSGTEFRKYQISAEILPDIRNQLAKRDLLEWKVYLDLDRLFNQWKKE